MPLLAQLLQFQRIVSSKIDFSRSSLILEEGDWRASRMGDISERKPRPQAFSSTELTTGWEFRETEDSDGWMAVKRVPSVVQQDLIDNKK